MAQTLDERFKDRPPTRGPADHHAWLSAEERRFILWALRDRWSGARIGRALDVHEATVRRFRKRVWDDPTILLELGLLEMIGKIEDDEWRCLVCGLRVEGRRQGERHLALHFVDEYTIAAILPPAPRSRRPRRTRTSPPQRRKV